MSISSRIASMEEHIGNAYQGLQNIGADITGVNKNIENISSMLEEAYKEAPKVSDTGTDITLDNTRKGRVDMGFSGNTSQETTTGKNFYSTSMLPVTEYGITISKNANGDIVLNGTPNFSEGYKTFYTGDVITVEAGTYTLSVANKIAGIGCVVGGFNGGCNLTLTDTVTSKTAYADTPQNVNPAINIRYDVGTLTNFVLNPQMEKSSSATTYEPFTNGASPNPDYPQDIHVVSGDNEINVCGKNMFDDSIVTNIWSEYSTNKIVSANGANLHKFNCKQGDTFTLKATYNSASSGGVILIQFFDNNDNSLGRYASANDTTLTLTKTAPANTSYAYMGRYVNTPTTIQLEKNNQATTYEPYQGNTYPINLPVENLFDGELEQGSYDGNGAKSPSNINYRNKNIIAVKPNTTYTFSIDGINQKYCTYYYDTNKTLLSMDLALATGTFTTPNNCYYLNFRCFQADYVNNFTSLKVQLEKGSKTNSYTPYGTTPIELAEISTYNDEIFRTSGKNLCNGINQSVYLNNDVNRCGVASGDSGLYIPVNGGNYTISTLVSQTRYRVACSNDLPPSVGSAIAYNGQNKDNTSNSITINTTGYNYLIVNATDLSAIQIEKGTTATEYNPYGTGEWYLHKEIGKVVLNGSESWIYDSSHTRFLSTIYSTATMLRGQGFCDHYKYGDSVNSGYFDINIDKKTIYMFTPDNSITTSNTFKTWLGTNLPIVYYVLATSTNTEITYQPLINQLNELEKAMSKDGQTNISQVNNDLPFEITASALEG